MYAYACVYVCLLVCLCLCVYVCVYTCVHVKLVYLSGLFSSEPSWSRIDDGDICVGVSAS